MRTKSVARQRRSGQLVIWGCRGMVATVARLAMHSIRLLPLVLVATCGGRTPLLAPAATDASAAVAPASDVSPARPACAPSGGSWVASSRLAVLSTPSDVRQGPDGSVWVAGRAGYAAQRPTLWRYGPSAELLDTLDLGAYAPVNNLSGATCLAFTARGTVLAGISDDDASSIVELSPSGELIRQISVGIAGRTANLKSIAVDDHGDVWVFGDTGHSRATTHENGIWISKLSTDLAERWSDVQSDDNEHEYAQALALDPTGNAYALSIGFRSSQYEARIVKYASTGSILWVRQDRAQVSLLSLDAGVGPDGSMVAVGSHESDLWLRKYDAQGGVLWTRIVDHDYETDPAVVVDPRGAILVAATGSEGLLMEYDGDGNRCWLQAFTEPDWYYGIHLALGADGQLWATDAMHGPTNFHEAWLGLYQRWP